MKKKVILGLSGGVDSAVAAYILKEQGYDVECAFMRNWDSAANNDLLGNPTIENDICPQEQDYNDAVSVANVLGLKIHRIDFIEEYWTNVFSTFIDEYKKGRTPNPDILCNKYIKFDCFLKFAEKMGADYIATGHYARVEHHEKESILLRGVDSNKDQTYFLCQLNQAQLSKTLFPIGDIEKPEVRRIAKELKLDIANKKDSTGICFIGERNFREFLKNYIPMKEGNIVDYVSKKVIGCHQGVMYYTIGQRKGLNIGGKGGPWFVIGKNVIKNELYVCDSLENDWLLSDQCKVADVNWISTLKFEGKLACTAKFRYRQPDSKVCLEWINTNEIIVTFDALVSSVTPGQEAVFYLNDVCLGGGVIDKVLRKGKCLEYIE